MDNVSRIKRSEIMGKVGQKNTGPELRLRSALHKIGLRYRLHSQKLPGTPDLVLKKYNAVIFVHGCFWHRHGCHRSTFPKSRQEFWAAKFAANIERDERKKLQLRKRGWRTLVVWECALVGRFLIKDALLSNEVREWLTGESTDYEIAGAGNAIRLPCRTDDTPPINA